MKTIEEKAKQRAFEITSSLGLNIAELIVAINDVYIEAATEALAGQWRSVEDESPDGTPFCVTMADEESRLCLCHFDGDVFIEDYSGLVCAVKYWMPIPFLPPKNESV